MNINKLVEVLGKLKNGVAFIDIKHEIEKVISEMDISDLYFAEHQMLGAGISSEDIKIMFSKYKKKEITKIDSLKEKLDKDHVLYTLISEHEMLFELLDKLKDINFQLQDRNNYQEAKPDIEELLFILKNFKKLDFHELREEKVLFPQLDSRGIFGHPYIMQLEHKIINDYRQELHLLASSAAERDFDKLKDRINILTKFLIIKLSDHFNEENNLIYPIAFKVIEDEKVWDTMKRACDRIGYYNLTKAT